MRRPARGLAIATTLFLLVTFVTGCSLLNSLLNPNHPPTAAINASPKEGNFPLTVNFNGDSSFDENNNDYITSYDWDYGDGTQGVGAVTTHTYEEIGDYQACLTVSDSEGSMDTACIQIHASDWTAERVYEWMLDNTWWTWTLYLPASLYYDYKRRGRTNVFSEYVEDPGDDKFMEKLANELNSTSYNPANMALRFAQYMIYATDKVTTGYDEYPRYPVETLWDYGGDCEDTSILVASLLRELNYGVILLVCRTVQNGHMAVGIKVSWSTIEYLANFYDVTYIEYKNDYYIYGETTASGWEWGQMPSGVIELIKIYDVSLDTFIEVNNFLTYEKQ